MSTFVALERRSSRWVCCCFRLTSLFFSWVKNMERKGRFSMSSATPTLSELRLSEEDGERGFKASIGRVRSWTLMFSTHGGSKIELLQYLSYARPAPAELGTSDIRWSSRCPTSTRSDDGMNGMASPSAERGRRRGHWCQRPGPHTGCYPPDRSWGKQ